MNYLIIKKLQEILSLPDLQTTSQNILPKPDLNKSHQITELNQELLFFFLFFYSHTNRIRFFYSISICICSGFASVDLSCYVHFYLFFDIQKYFLNPDITILIDFFGSFNIYIHLHAHLAKYLFRLYGRNA